jgi:hypothetical protein
MVPKGTYLIVLKGICCNGMKHHGCTSLFARLTNLIMKRQLLCLVLIALCGCGTYSENQQLTRINKDWNLLIRASHIYPVYPLSQDILPGDIFFVSANIDDTSAWNEKGYLPLDHMVARLYPSNYMGFYSNSWSEYTNSLPGRWLHDNSWSNAPVAGFPSYSFSVQQGGGASVALPIQGIPVGLSLMEAKRASGYVTLADAHTYGVDEVSLREQVWDYVNSHQKELSFLVAPGDTSTYYLQVVSRVYSVGQVAVSMFNDSAVGGSLWGGSPKDVSTPSLVPAGSNTLANTAANFSNMVNAVNGTVPSAANAANILPGGTLKFNMVSGRSVSMDETFPKPVIIGYNGFSFSVTRTNYPVTKTITNGLSIQYVTNSEPRIWLGEAISNEKLLRRLKR